MRFKEMVMGLIGIGTVLGILPQVEAQEYLVNQGYETAEKGEFEVEFYDDLNLSDLDNDNTYHSKHQIEFEYGITDHFQIAYYEVYTWDRTDDRERDALNIEAKWRFAEAGEWPVDAALYTEYENPNGRRDVKSDESENKIILGKEFGPWSVVGNFVFEKKINTKSHWDYEYTVGTNYRIGPETRMGIEFKQELGDSGDFGFDRERAFYVIPAVYAKVAPHVHLLAGPAFGLSRGSDDVQFKSIVEVEF